MLGPAGSNMRFRPYHGGQQNPLPLVLYLTRVNIYNVIFRDITAPSLIIVIYFIQLKRNYQKTMITRWRPRRCACRWCARSARCACRVRVARPTAPICSASTPRCSCRWTSDGRPGCVPSATGRRPTSRSSWTGKDIKHHSNIGLKYKRYNWFIFGSNWCRKRSWSSCKDSTWSSKSPSFNSSHCNKAFWTRCLLHILMSLKYRNFATSLPIVASASYQIIYKENHHCYLCIICTQILPRGVNVAAAGVRVQRDPLA